MALLATTDAVRPEWVDFHGHMSASYYCVAFAEANRSVSTELDSAPEAQTAGDFGVYVVGACYRYRAEMRLADPYRIDSRLGEVDAKSFRLHHQMARADGRLAAEADIVFLHVDKRGLRAANFSDSTRARLAAKAAEPATQE